MLYGGKFVRLDYQKGTFSHLQCVYRDIANDKKFTPPTAAIIINAIVADQVFEPIR